MRELIEEHDVKAETLTVKDVTPIEGKDRIELVWLFQKAPYGEPCIVQKNKHKVGDYVIYIPPDHVVPDVEQFAFLNKGGNLDDGSKFVRRKHRRVRAMKMAGCISHGLVIGLREGDSIAMTLTGVGIPGSFRKQGVVGEFLGITRYVPKQQYGSAGGKKMGASPGPKGLSVPKYDLNGIRKAGDIFGWEDGKSAHNLVITEKLHGCNARYVVTKVDRTLWGQIWLWLRTRLGKRTASPLESKDHRLHISSRTTWRGIENDNDSLWKEVAEQQALFPKLVNLDFIDIVLYGEIVGRRVQGDQFLYGTKDDGLQLYIFDIYDPKSKLWFSWGDVERICSLLGLRTVPVLAEGKFSRDEVEKYVDGWSYIDNRKTMREGIVVRTVGDYRDSRGNRLIIKWKSERFLQKHG